MKEYKYANVNLNKLQNLNNYENFILNPEHFMFKKFFSKSTGQGIVFHEIN